MAKLYHVDYHLDPNTSDEQEINYFYVWDEQDNFEAINVYLLTTESIVCPAHVDSDYKMDDFLVETENDEITPVARSLHKEQLIPHMLTYALLHGLPTKE